MLHLSCLKECDYALMVVRLDSIIGEPFLNGPAVLPSDIYIYSFKFNESEEAIEVTDVFEDISESSLCYFLIIFVWSSVFLIIFSNFPTIKRS